MNLGIGQENQLSQFLIECSIWVISLGKLIAYGNMDVYRLCISSDAFAAQSAKVISKRVTHRLLF